MSMNFMICPGGYLSRGDDIKYMQYWTSPKYFGNK